MELTEIRDEIPLLSGAQKIEHIQKGFSSDAKYFIYPVDTERPAYVLRISDHKNLRRKQDEFEIIRAMNGYGVNTSQAVSFGTLKNGAFCYQLLSYVEGQDADGLLPLCTSDEQYRIGWEAGKDLLSMHRMQAPPQTTPWESRKLAKYKRVYEAYKECGITLKEEAGITAFIEANLHLLRNRPNSFQHDDFHVHNLLIQGKRYTGVIDFNRYDWGDPVHDFYKIAYFSRQVSTPFSIGQIQGYYDGKIPEPFWQLYALYTAMIILPTLVWTLQTVPGQLDGMLQRIRVILNDHHGFKYSKPEWFKE
ncbi:MAG: Aminoglycoside phosphotransferase [Paenibacillus sp.]|jgi:aminoglycoside phosphotransferase (APT) family kinase protein|nr:Aminoglycoside phosphotransferase [Paenibacillus sp.]